jgi:hypothetical protein
MSKRLLGFNLNFSSIDESCELNVHWEVKNDGQDNVLSTSTISGENLITVLNLPLSNITKNDLSLSSIIMRISDILNENIQLSFPSKIKLRVISATSGKSLASSVVVKNAKTLETIFEGAIEEDDENSQKFSELSFNFCPTTDIFISSPGYLSRKLSLPLLGRYQDITIRLVEES